MPQNAQKNLEKVLHVIKMKFKCSPSIKGTKAQKKIWEGPPFSWSSRNITITCPNAKNHKNNSPKQ